MEHALIRKIIDCMNEVFLGQDEVVRSVVCGLLAGGHVLLEGVPGVGKTLIGLAVSRLLNVSFQRIQFTNDLLPSDVIGFHAIRGGKPGFDLVKGPIFASIVLTDEINRTSPKTQSALLEAMQERHVTIDGSTYDLPLPFMVIATQNPVETAGTFPLPESQLDRFLFKVRVGYPALEDERQIIERGIDHTQALGLEPVMDIDTLLSMIDLVGRIRLHPEVLDYLAAVVRSTRDRPEVELGVSPRGGLALKKASQAWAFLHGRDFVTPGDVRTMAFLVLPHRIMTRGGDPYRVLEAVLQETPVPL